MIDKVPVVAVVDDDPRLRDSLSNLLESAGYIACIFPSAEALLASRLEQIDLLITDIGLPGIDGFGLRALIGEERPGLPVFMITGRHEFAEQIQGHKVTGIFCKPFDAAALLSAVGKALGDREMEDGHDC
ncbi:MAG: response regulator [Sphingomonadales bacterium]|mgnify:CR=1 FL=1|nr:response regulator [Sphingomonadales bacterium]